MEEETFKTEEGMSGGTTAIRISEKTWKKLNNLRKTPSQTFEDVIIDLIKLRRGEENG